MTDIYINFKEHTTKNNTTNFRLSRNASPASPASPLNEKNEYIRFNRKKDYLLGDYVFHSMITNGEVRPLDYLPGRVFYFKKGSLILSVDTGTYEVEGESGSRFVILVMQEVHGSWFEDWDARVNLICYLTIDADVVAINGVWCYDLLEGYAELLLLKLARRGQGRGLKRKMIKQVLETELKKLLVEYA